MAFKELTPPIFGYNKKPHPEWQQKLAPPSPSPAAQQHSAAAGRMGGGTGARRQRPRGQSVGAPHDARFFHAGISERAAQQLPCAPRGPGPVVARAAQRSGRAGPVGPACRRLHGRGPGRNRPGRPGTGTDRRHQAAVRVDHRRDTNLATLLVNIIHQISRTASHFAGEVVVLPPSQFKCICKIQKMSQNKCINMECSYLCHPCASLYLSFVRRNVPPRCTTCASLSPLDSSKSFTPHSSDALALLLASAAPHQTPQCLAVSIYS